MKKWMVFLLLCFTAVVFGDACSVDACNMEPVIVPPATPEAVKFYKSGNVLWIVQLLWSMFIPALILFTGFSAKIRNLAGKISSIWLVKTALFVIFFFLITVLLTALLDYYTSYIRPHAYGLSTQAFSRWLNHYLIGNGLSLLAGIIVVWILYGVIRRSPRRWWLYFGLLSVPLTIFFAVIYPIWVSPLFNDFGPMKNKELEQKILNLASEAGIEGSRVYEVNKSADTKQINAYVTGIGATKRIVLWDTAIEGLSEDELLFVVGHEMGHYVLNHIWWGIAFSGLITIVTLFLVYCTGEWIIKKGRKRLGFSQMSDIASLPLIILVYTFYSTLLSPAENVVSQRIEHNADTFGLELTKLNHAAGTGFVKLQMTNLGYPWPGELFMLFRATHPSIGQRITYYNNYKPWCEGKPLKYQKFISAPQE